MATKTVTETRTQKKTNFEKKMSKTFVTYLHKVLKKVSDAHIGVDTVEQLSSALKVVVSNLSYEARNLCVYAKRCTVGDRDIITAVNILIPQQLASEIHTSITDALEYYRNYQEENPRPHGDGKVRAPPVRMETQAGLVFSVSFVENILRDYGMSNLNMSKKAKIALAAAAEHIAATVLDIASDYVRDLKKKTIYVRHLSMAINDPSVEGNEDLRVMCESFNIEFLGGGVVPGYHPSLNKPKTKKPKARGAKSPPGDKSLSNIKEIQQTTDLLLQKDPFGKEVRAIVNNLINEVKSLKMLKNKVGSEQKQVVRFSFGTISTLQYFVEQRVTSLLRDAVFVAIFAGHEGVKEEDVDLVWNLSYPKIPYIYDDGSMVYGMEEKNKINRQPVGLEKLSRNGIERLAQRGGVKRKRKDMFVSVRQFMYSLLYRILFHALHYIDHRYYVTINLTDLERSIRQMGINFTIPANMGKPKNTPKNTRKKSNSTPNSPAPPPRARPAKTGKKKRTRRRTTAKTS